MDPQTTPAGMRDDQDALGPVLSYLNREMCRPLDSLRLGFDDILKDRAPSISPDQRGQLATMVEVCDDLIDLTRTYLDFAGLLQGAPPLRLERVSLAGLVREADARFAPVAAAKGLAWQCGHKGGKNVAVTTDPILCRQILPHLVSNAINATPEGGRVRVEVRGGEGNWSLAVSDTGPGIPEEARDRVFEPFFQLKRERCSERSGHGLGLAICRELVKRLEGIITIEPVKAGGTRVMVVLPDRADGSAD